MKAEAEGRNRTLRAKQLSSAYNRNHPRVLAQCADATLRGFAHRVQIGAPLVGPLIDAAAFHRMQETLAEAQKLGGQVVGGDRFEAVPYPAAYYVKPALVEMPGQIGPVLRETFAPILYVMK